MNGYEDEPRKIPEGKTRRKKEWKGEKVAPGKDWKESLRYNWEERLKKEGLEEDKTLGGWETRQGPGTRDQHPPRHPPSGGP